MKNPWTQLPSQAPFVLPCDERIVNEFNRHYRDTPNLVLQTQLLPEPFIGDPAIPVYVLNLNPGFSPEGEKWHDTTDYRAAKLANLTHQFTGFPFYLLRPEFEGMTDSR